MSCVVSFYQKHKFRKFGWYKLRSLVYHPTIYGGFGDEDLFMRVHFPLSTKLFKLILNLIVKHLAFPLTLFLLILKCKINYLCT